MSARFTGDDADHRFVLSSLWPFFWAATRPNLSMLRPSAKINLKKCCQMWALLTSVTLDGEGDSTFVVCSSRPFFWAITRLNLSMIRPSSYGILIPYLFNGPHWSPLVPILGKCCQLLLLSLMVKVIPDSYIVRCARFFELLIGQIPWWEVICWEL